MARVRVADQAALESWDAVDMALCEIGGLQRDIERVEAVMQQSIDDAKLAADMAAAPSKARIAELEQGIKAFVEEHRDDMGGKKTRALNFGQTGFRKSTKILIPRAAAKVAEIIRRLREAGMGDCVVAPPPKVDKNALGKYPPNDIIAVGAGVQTDDQFWYEVDREKIV